MNEAFGESIPASQKKYRETSLRIFAGRQTLEDEWLIEEVVSKLSAGEDEKLIAKTLVNQGATGEDRVIQVGRDRYWLQIFENASQEVAAGRDTSSSVEQASIQARAMANTEIACRDLQLRLENAGCSKPLAKHLAYRSDVAERIRQNCFRDLGMGGSFATLGLVVLAFTFRSSGLNVGTLVLIGLGGIQSLRGALRLSTFRR